MKRVVGQASWVIGAIAVLGVALTVGIFVWARKEALRDFRNAFQVQSSTQSTHLLTYLNARLLFLDDLARHLELAEAPTRENFSSFVAAERARVDGIQALEWAPKVTQNQRAGIQAQLREAFLGTPSILERGEDGTLREAKSRPQYFPVFFLEPVAGNEAAIGYDLGSNPARLATIEAARDSGLPKATEPLTLVQEKKTQPGFLVFVPVYAKGMPTGSVRERQAAFQGAVLGVFRTGDLIAAALGEIRGAGLRGELSDPASAWSKGPVHVWGEPLPGEPSRPSFFNRLLLTATPSTQARLPFAGRIWAASYRPNPAYVEAHLQRSLWLVIPIGLALTVLLASVLHLLYSQKHRAESLVEERSRELTESLAKLSLQEDDLRLLLDSTAEAIYGIDLQGKCTFCNPACLRLTGYADFDQVLGKNMHDLIHHSHVDGSHFPVETCRIFQAFNNGIGTHVVDEVLWRMDGSSFPAEYWSFPQHRMGQIVGAVVTFIDITERTRVEQKLRENENNFRTFFETMDDLIVVGTPEGHLLYTNAAVSEKLGYQAEELKTMSVLELHPPEKRREAEAILGAMLCGETEFCPLPLQTKQGWHIPVETRIWFGKWDGMDCIFGLSKDLREQQASLQKFNRLFQNNPALMAVSSLPDRRFTEVNDAFTAALGFTREEALGRTAEELGLFPEPALQLEIVAKLEQYGRMVNTELKVQAKDGSLLDGLFSGEIIDDQGQLSLLTVMVNITERRRNEVEIRRQQALIHSLLDSIPDIIFFKDQNGVYLGCNPPFAELVGQPREAIVGHTDRDLFDSELADCFREHDRLMLQELRPRHNDEWITYPDGRRVLVDTLKTPYYGPSGELVGILGISRDITERKLVEEALTQAADRLLVATRAGHVGIWEFDLINERLTWDDQMYRLYGIRPEAFSGAYEAWTAGLHPGDLLRGDAEIQLALRGDKEFDTEFRVVWPDGSIHDIRALALVHRDAAGQPLRMVGTNWDISPLKELERRLIEKEQILDALGRSVVELLDAPEVEPVLQDFLAALGQGAGASRTYLFKTDPGTGTQGELLMTPTLEWCQQGVDSQICQRTPISGTGGVRMVTELAAGRMISRDVETCPEAERPALTALGIQSMLLLPVTVHGALWGLIGFDECHGLRHWSRSEQDSLLLSARALGTVVERHEVHAELKTAQADLEVRVARRTLELQEVNQNLQAEMTIRMLAESRLSSITQGFLQLGPEVSSNLDILVGLMKDLTGAKCACYFSKDASGLHLVSALPLEAGSLTAAMLAFAGNLPQGMTVTMDLADSESGATASILVQAVHTEAKVVGILAGVRGPGSEWSAEDRTVLGILAAAAGIEERRGRAEAKNSRVQIQLHQAQKLESVGRLAAGIAHEINTPIQFLSMNLRFLQKTYGQLMQAFVAARTPNPRLQTGAELSDLAWIEEETPKVLSDSLEGIEHVARIVRAMKEFSHPGSPDPMALDINKCLESSSTVSRNEWKYVAHLSLLLASDLPMIHGFPAELNQVFLNLIVNAAQAIASKPRPDGTLGEITISTLQVPEGVEIQIKDTGIGILPEHQAKVFDPFFTTKEVGIGTGQGLMVCHQAVVNLHGGRIFFRTKLGEGSTFIVQLPLRAAPTKVISQTKGAA